MSEQKTKNEELGAVWRYKNDQMKYFKGHITIKGEKVQIIMFQNTYKKEGDKSPDYRIYKSVPREKPATSGTTAAAAPKKEESPSKAAPAVQSATSRAPSPRVPIPAPAPAEVAESAQQNNNPL
jgi:hypothetical protein